MGLHRGAVSPASRGSTAIQARASPPRSGPDAARVRTGVCSAV